MSETPGIQRVCGRCSVIANDLGSNFCIECGTPFASIANKVSPQVTAKPQAKDQLWHDLKRVILLYGALLLTLVPLFFLTDDLVVIGMTTCGVIQALIILATGLRIPRFFPTQFRMDARVMQWLGIAVIMTGILISLNWLYAETMKYLFGAGLLQLPDPFKKHGYSLEYEIIVVAVMPAIWEEIAFRGIIQTSLTRVIGIHQALIIGAALFAILHCQFAMIPYFAVFGYVIGVIRWQSGSLYPGIVLHFLHNAVVCLYFS